MERPPLSVIQASVMLCSILVCADDEKAFRFVTMYHARNLSVSPNQIIEKKRDQWSHRCLRRRWPNGLGSLKQEIPSTMVF